MASVLVLGLEALFEPIGAWNATAVPLPRPPVLPPLMDPLTPIDVPPSAFMGTELRRNGWIVRFWVAALLVNVVDEELVRRGYVLPRQEAAFGRWAWAVNGLLWAFVVHTFTFWNAVTLLPTSL